MRVKQILGRKDSVEVITLPPFAKVADAAQLLSEKKIGAVIISSDNRKPLGIVSERDIVRELGRRGPESLQDSVEDLMTRDLVCCEPNENSKQILTKMSDGRFRHMPVMEDDMMIGIVSIGDVVKARLSELAMERDALKDMVMGH